MTADLDGLQSALGDRYAIERELGRGGMATVYLAEDAKHGRQVAIKVLHPELAAALGTARFLREIETAAQLSHPHILSLHDSGEADGFLYYVMPYVEGESLRDRLQREEQLPVDEALAIAAEVADALSYAHEQGVVHRDVKPENILLSGGHALVADFGIARAVTQAGGERLTETGLAVGTPYYMSPEQAGGEDALDGRSDQYGLACVVYEMLAGAPPFTGPTPQAVLARHAVDPVPPIKTIRDTIPEAVDAAVRRGLAKEPSARYPTATDFVDALRAKPATVRPLRARNALLAAAAIVVVLLAVALLRYGGTAGRAPAVPLDTNLIAVMPFRISVADSSLQYLREGIPNLLGFTFGGRGAGFATVDHGTIAEAWQNALAEGETDLDEARQAAIARRFGAGLVLRGAVVGGRDELQLIGALHDVRTSEEVTHSVTGPADSAASMVYELGIRLVSQTRVALDYRQLPAEIQERILAASEVLDSVERTRGGQGYLPVAQHVGAILDIDSTLADVALLLMDVTKGSCPGPECGRLRDRAVRLAWMYRMQLSDGDRLLLQANLGPNHPAPSTLRERLDFHQAAIDSMPTYPWLYGGLAGDLAWYGRQLAIPDWGPRALAALETRAELLGLDRPSGTLWIALLADDAERLRDWAAHEFSDLPELHAWGYLVALYLGDSAEVRRHRDHLDEWNPGNTLAWATMVGLPLDDSERRLSFMEEQAVTSDDRRRVMNLRRDLAMQRGRMRTLLALRDSVSGGFASPRKLIEWAVANPGIDDVDTAAAAAAQELTVWADTALWAISGKTDFSSRPDDPWDEAAGRLCVGELWRVAYDGDTTRTQEVTTLFRRLIEYRGWHGCAVALEALVEARRGPAEAAPALERLDSLMLTGGEGPLIWTANLISTRLHRRRGEWDAALKASRRRQDGGANGLPYLAAYLREEGDMAARTGDIDGAIRAYTHYLTLRTDPDPGAMAQQVEAVRRSLAALVEQRSSSQ
jgi:serine/threonine-protein kinase